jgi:hypothetical protein
MQNKEGHFYKMVQETGKAMAQQLHRVAEEASNHVNKNIFHSEILNKNLLYTLAEVSMETETRHLIK